MVHLKHIRQSAMLSAMFAAALLLVACAEPRTWPGAPTSQPELAYCYVTLANVDCYGNPEPGQAYRQVGRAVMAPH